MRMIDRTGYALGIDLGTTYSAAAVARGDVVEVCTLGSTAAQIPSVILLREDGEILTGEAAEHRAPDEPARTAREFKRRLGDPVPLIVGGTPYGAEALLAHLLRAIIEQVAGREGSAPDVVVLTHPANYSEYKKGLLLEAARLAGLDLAQVLLVTEPEAAAITHARQQRVEVGDVAAGAALLGSATGSAQQRGTVAGWPGPAALTGSPGVPPSHTIGGVRAVGAGIAGVGLAAVGAAAVVGGGTVVAAKPVSATLAGPAGVPLGLAGPAGVPLGLAGPAGVPLGLAGPAGVPLGLAGPAGVPLDIATAVARRALPRYVLVGGAAAALAVAVGAAAILGGGSDGNSRAAVGTAAAVTEAAGLVVTVAPAPAEVTVASVIANPIVTTVPAIAEPDTTDPGTTTPVTVVVVAGRGLEGIVELVAGSGTDDNTGVPGPAAGASLGSRVSFAVAPTGDVFTISALPTVLRVRGDIVEEIYVGGDGEFAFGGIAVGPNGDAYVTMSTGVKRIGADGASELVVDAEAEGLGRSFGPIAFDAVGNLYFYESTTYRVMRRGVDGALSHVAGSGTQGPGGQAPVGDGGPAIAAPLSSVVALAVDGQGNLLIADVGQAVVRSVGADGTITTIAGGGAVPVSASVGEFATDGTAPTDLKLGVIGGITVDGSGQVYVSDGLFNVIVRFEPGAGIELVIADQTDSVESIGMPANRTRIRNPIGLAVDAGGNLLFTDASRVLRIVGAAG